MNRRSFSVHNQVIISRSFLVRWVLKNDKARAIGREASWSLLGGGHRDDLMNSVPAGTACFRFNGERAAAMILGRGPRGSNELRRTEGSLAAAVVMELGNKVKLMKARDFEVNFSEKPLIAPKETKKSLFPLLLIGGGRRGL